MKKILVLLLFITATVTGTTQAQERLTVKSDTLVNADTAYATFDVVPSKIKSFQLDLNKISGTVTTSGYALLEGTVNGVTWVQAAPDSMILTNNATTSKVWTVSNTSFVGYRACIRIPSGTQSSRATFTWCRRKDE